MGKFYEGLLEALILYVRHAAWLNAVPDGGKPITGKERVSRMEEMTGAGIVPDMPEIELEYLIGYLFEVGPTMAGGMSGAPLSHGEIAAWQSNTGIELQPWEVRFLRSLSIEYLAQAQKSEKPDCPPPFGLTERRSLVADKIDAAFG